MRNPGGHSSLPRKDNAIYALAARARARRGVFEFPAKPNDVVKAYFSQAAADRDAGRSRRRHARGRDRHARRRRDRAAERRRRFYNALLRTTCVATMLEGGHAENALPQTAKATVNCRMLPGDDPAAVEQDARRASIGDTAVASRADRHGGAEPAVAAARRSVFASIDGVGEERSGGRCRSCRCMETGATDGLYLRNAGVPVYGFTGLFIAIDDVRAHGKDERILIRRSMRGWISPTIC